MIVKREDLHISIIELVSTTQGKLYVNVSTYLGNTGVVKYVAHCILQMVSKTC